MSLRAGWRRFVGGKLAQQEECAATQQHKQRDPQQFGVFVRLAQPSRVTRRLSKVERRTRQS